MDPAMIPSLIEQIGGGTDVAPYPVAADPLPDSLEVP